MKKVAKKAKSSSITKTQGKTTSGVTAKYGPGYKPPVTTTGPAYPTKKVKKTK